MEDTLNVMDEGEIDTCLGVEISIRPTPDAIELTQPRLIQRGLHDAGTKSSTRAKDKSAPFLQQCFAKIQMVILPMKNGVADQLSENSTF